MKEYTYSKKLKWYVNDARNWIEQYVCGSDWILNNLDEKISGIYKIEFNGKVAYIGESGNVPTRLLEHAYYIAEYPEYNWGLYLRQIKDGTVKITMEYIEIEIPETGKRQDKEIKYLNQYGSLLQRNKDKNNNSTDICTDNKGKRLDYMQSALKLN